MKKIVVFYGAYGGGHIAAAKSIATHLFEEDDVDVEAIDCIEYVSKYMNKMTTGAYKGGTKHTPRLWKFFYEKSNEGALAKFVNTSNNLLARKLKKLIDELKPDLIISTHPFCSQMCAFLKKKKLIHCKLATVMTDFHVHNQWFGLHEFVDFFFIANDIMKNEMVKLEIEEKKIHVTGIPISDRFNNNFNDNEIYEELWLDSQKPTILFFGGGEFGLGREASYMALKTIIRLFKEVQVVAISGKNKKMYNRFEELIQKTNSSSRVKLFEYTDKVPELMHICGLVITKAGGLTIAESLASSLPIVIINPIPGQEEENAEFLVNSGCAIWIKKDDSIVRSLKNLSRDKEKLSKMKEASIALAKPNATKDICDILINELNKKS